MCVCVCVCLCICMYTEMRSRKGNGLITFNPCNFTHA